jgi:S-DNA-T family DNA segregation ATPase FtsK/SpoIIIE
MVSMKSVIGSAKFQEAEMELPIALGKQFRTKRL